MQVSAWTSSTALLRKLANSIAKYLGCKRFFMANLDLLGKIELKTSCDWRLSDEPERAAKLKAEIKSQERISNNGAVAISVEYFVNIFDFNIA
jgi:hypothetical protein